MDQRAHFGIAQHHGYLGPVIELRVEAADQDVCDSMDHAAIAEIGHLEGIFDLFDPTSGIGRWRRRKQEPGPAARPGECRSQRQRQRADR